MSKFVVEERERETEWFVRHEERLTGDAMVTARSSLM